MKKAIKQIAAITSLFAVLILFNSCEKDKGLLPNISFKTGATYTSADGTKAKNTAFTVGIDASKAEDKDVLKTFTATVQYDGSSTSTTFYSENLTGSQGDNYSKDLTPTTRNQSGTEKWTFTVTNRDGLVNSVSLTVTVP